MADWMQSAALTIHRRAPGVSQRRSRRKQGSDGMLFDDILATGDQYDTESEEGGSIAFTSSKKQSQVLKKGKKSGGSRAQAYAEATEDPNVYIQQYHYHLQQRMNDGDGRLVQCWEAFKKALVGCCTSRRTLERDMALADYRYKIMKLRQEAEKAKELERKQETDRKLDAVVRKYKLEEQKKRQLQKLKKAVQKEWAKAVSPQPRHLTEEEVKDLKIFRKQAGDLRLKIQRLQDKEAMSETCTCSESEDMSEDESGLQLLQRERDRLPHLKQQQGVALSLSEPCHKCGMVTAVDSRLTKEEMELLQKVRDQHNTLLLKIKALEDRENKAMNKTHKLSPEGTGYQTLPGSSGISQEKMGNIKMAQHTEAMAHSDKIAQLDERDMERWNKLKRLIDLLTEAMERLREADRNSEKGLVPECSGTLNSLEVMKLKMEIMKLKEIKSEREVVREMDTKYDLLEMQIKAMERNFAQVRGMDEKRFEESLVELESKCEQEFEAKMQEMEHNIEKERETSQWLEEQLLKYQQKAKVNTARHTEGKMDKQRQRHIDMEQQLEQTDVKCQNMGSETEGERELATDEEEMQDQLMKIELHFAKEEEMDWQNQEGRFREIEEKCRQEWKEKTRELEAQRQLTRQRELVLVKLRDKLKETKELKHTEKKANETKTSVNETRLNAKQEKKTEKAKAWRTEIRQSKTEDEGKAAEEKKKPGTERLDWLGELRQRGEKNKEVHQEQLSLGDASKDVFLQDLKERKVPVDAEQNHEELEDDWLEGMGLQKGKDKWSEIRKKHQQSREESKQALEKQLNHGQQTETNNCTMVRQRGRRRARETDAENPTVAENKQERKDDMKLQNKRRDPGELQEKVSLEEEYLDLNQGKDKWSEIRRRHQQSREESKQVLEKQIDQGEHSETNNCTVVRQKGRRRAKGADAENQTVTEENKQERKYVMNLQNEVLENLGELQPKASLQEEDLDLNQGKDKWSEIRRRHQQSREESKQVLEKQFDQGEHSETNNCTMVRQKGRRRVREVDAVIQETVTEENKQERKDFMNIQNEGLGSLEELQPKASLQEEALITKQKRQTEKKNNKNNKSLTPCSTQFTVSETEVMLKENQQREVTHPVRVKHSRIEREMSQKMEAPDRVQKEREVKLEMEDKVNSSESPNAADQKPITQPVKVKRHREVYQEAVQATSSQHSRPLRKSHKQTIKNVATVPKPVQPKESIHTLHGISMDTVLSEMKLQAEREEALKQERRREEEEREKQRESIHTLDGIGMDTVLSKINLEAEREEEVEEIILAEETHRKEDEMERMMGDVEVKPDEKSLSSADGNAEDMPGEDPENAEAMPGGTDPVNAEAMPGEDPQNAEAMPGGTDPVNAEAMPGEDPENAEATPGDTDPDNAEAMPGEDPENAEATPGDTDPDNAEAEGGNVKDKSVRRKVFGWVNQKMKNYYQKKIDRTYVREEVEGDAPYYPWYFDYPIPRAEREKQKRELLLEAESKRQKMEEKWQKWQAKRTEKKEKKMAKKQEKQQRIDEIENKVYQRHLAKTNQ